MAPAGRSRAWHPEAELLGLQRPNSVSYRITVKREADPNRPPRTVSNWLHDHAMPGTVLRVAPPASDFFLGRGTMDPVVLVSGGIGLTPMMSMLGAIASEAPERPTWYVHGTLNGRAHAMRRELAAATEANPNLHVRTFYAVPEARDQLGEDYDDEGLVTAEWLIANTPHAQATYYLCGPTPFLASLADDLARAGVPGERVRFEFFGPTLDLEAPVPALVA